MIAFKIKVHFYLIGILFFPFTELFQFEKRWTKTNSWTDPSNWSPPRLPCPKDNIVLTDDVVYIEHNVTLQSELDLPSDVEIVFGMNTNIVFGETTNKRKRRHAGHVHNSCSGEGGKVSFVGQHEKAWFNPNNWQIYTDGNKDDYMSKAVPYIERVPCHHDRISFPMGDAFKIDIEDEIAVKEVVINGDVITQDSELKSYLSTKEGRTRFNLLPPAGSLNVDSTGCGKAVCACGNQVWREKICDTFTCPPACERRVKPVNDCCYHCGALVDFTYHDNFHLHNCSNELRARLSTHAQYAHVRLYISDDEGKVQILLSEDSNGRAAESVADSIQSYINDNPSKACGGKGGSKLIAIVEKGASKQDEEETSSLALAVILPVLLVAIIIIVGTHVWRKRYPKITKRRFENENDFNQYPGFNDIEMTTDFTGAQIHSGETAFENPTYDVVEHQIGENETKSADAAFPEYAEIAVESLSAKVMEEAEEGIKEDEEARYVNVEVRLPEDVSGVANPMFDVHHGKPLSPLHTGYLTLDTCAESTSEVPQVELESADVAEAIKGKLELNLEDPSDVEDIFKSDGLYAEIGSELNLEEPSVLEDIFKSGGLYEKIGCELNLENPSDLEDISKSDGLYEEVGPGKPPDDGVKKEWVTDFES